jgi:hypothetical protein
MVSELHRMGYQHLRVMGYQHPNAWRLAIAPSYVFSEECPAFLPFERFESAAVYSSANEGAGYFDWPDASSDNSRALAEKFLARFSRVAHEGSGRDWEYAGWLSELLGALEQGNYVPVMYWEHMKGSPEGLPFIPIWDVESSNTYNDGSAYVVAALQPNVRQFPMPPPPTAN